MKTTTFKLQGTVIGFVTGIYVPATPDGIDPIAFRVVCNRLVSDYYQEEKLTQVASMGIGAMDYIPDQMLATGSLWRGG